jgi:transcription elongation factor GreA
MDLVELAIQCYRIRPNCDEQAKSSIIPDVSPDVANHAAILRLKRQFIDGSMTTDIADKLKKKIQDEIAALEHELHDELPQELKKARAHGDLSENAEYKYAKERQSYVSARLGQLHQRMADLAMLNLSNLPRDRAAYGSKLVVLDLKRSEKIEYKLVTAEEADAAKGMISTSSPIGRALLGKRVGDEVKVVTPAGVKEFEIVKLATIYDER